MTARLLNVRRLLRWAGNAEEALDFRPGVNVLVGEPNTGKTQWLRLLDYLLGDTGGVEEALGEECAQKYDRAQVQLTVDGEPLVLERRWKERGARHKLFVDGRPVPSADFSALFLERLGIPQVRIPRGNPYSPHTWPELSWRMLLRHLYRAEGAWGDLAPKQPESEQFAVLQQLLGTAPAVFSPAFAQRVERQKQEARLEAQAAGFAEVLDDVARELLSGAQAEQGLSPEALAHSAAQVQAELEACEARRAAQLQSLRERAEVHAASAQGEDVAQLVELGQALDAARTACEAQRAVRDAAAQRCTELARELELVQSAAPAPLEQGRPAPSHCPSCEQPVQPAPPGCCSLCQQPAPGAQSAQAQAARAAELQGALPVAQEDAALAYRRLVEHEEEVARLEALLRPVRAAAAWLLPPELGVLEQEAGRLQERLRQLQRLERALARRDELGRQLEALRAEIAGLEAQARREVEPDFVALGDQLADAMTGYLNALDARDRERWGGRAVSVTVTRQVAQLLVDRKPWSRKLGANLRAYFLLAYHYAGLRLCRTQPFTHPGLVVLDFPANLGEFTTSDQERYLLAPFVGLLSRPDMQGLQLIAAGRAFTRLPGAHRVDLSRRWR